MTIMGLEWQLWAFIGNHDILMAIVGLTLFLCIHLHLIYFFTIDPLGSTLTCYLSDFFFHKMTCTQNLKNQETVKEKSWKNFLQSQDIEHPSGVHM